MVTLTARERKVLFLVALLIIAGASLRYFLIKTRADIPVSYAGAATASARAIIDINRAATGQLETIPGIGPELAGRIVAYRRANGPFKTLADLTRVKGIGAKKMKAMEEYISF